MTLAFLFLGLLFIYLINYSYQANVEVPLSNLDNSHSTTCQLLRRLRSRRDCPPQRFLGRVTFDTESYGTPNHFDLTGPIPQGRNFTYNNDLTAVYQGQPPAYQTNCYQYPCLKTLSPDFTSTDVCWKCGDKPWAGPIRKMVNCPPLKPTC